MSAPSFEPATGTAMVPLSGVTRILGYGRSKAYAAMAVQLLPRPVKLGRASRWPEEELLALRAAIVRGDDEGCQRALVRRLVQARGGQPLQRVR